MRIAGLDISKNRIGLAFSDEEGKFVAHSFLVHTPDQIKKLYEEYKPSYSIIGLPGWGHNRDYIKSFVHNNRALLRPFVFIDEIYSTELTKRFNPKLNKDECAARLFVYFSLNNREFISHKLSCLTSII